MDKQRIAQSIKNELGKPDRPKNQKELAKITGLDVATVSRMMQGLGSELVFANVCKCLGLSTTDYKPLKIAFSSGFWAAPLLAKNEEPRLTMTKEFFKHVRLTAYSDSRNDEPIFSLPGKHLEKFDDHKHSFYFSGEVADKVESGQVDIGFLGSSLAQNNKFIRVAQVVDASSARHALLVLSPCGTFKNKTGTQELIEEILDILLNKPQPKKPKCLFLYQPGSTSAKEYELLFHDSGHDHEDIQILNIPAFKQAFIQKVKANKGKIIVMIALMMTVDAAKKAVDTAFNEKKTIFDLERFRTVEAVQNEKIKYRMPPNEQAFCYDMVIRKKYAKEIVRHEGFPALLLYLSKTIEELTKARVQPNDPDVFKRVASFYDLDKDEAIQRLRKTEFRLMFYSDFVEILLDMAHGDKLNF